MSVQRLHDATACWFSDREGGRTAKARDKTGQLRDGQKTLRRFVVYLTWDNIKEKGGVNDTGGISFLGGGGSLYYKCY